MKKIVIIGVLALLIVGSFYYFGVDEYLTLDKIKENKGLLVDYYEKNQFFTLLFFFIGYVVMAAFSLPGAVFLTLLAGFLFGNIVGVSVVSFASAIGATAAFLISRVVIGQYVQKKYHQYLSTINAGIEKEGGFYLFTLRLIPIFPFFLINLVMGLTRISIWKYYVVSQIGMFPGTLVYVNAGKALASISAVKDILSFQIIFAFSMLGILPIVLNLILKYIRKRQ